MLKLSNPLLLKILSTLLVLIVIAKSLALVALWFLPSDGVSLQTQSDYKPKYQRVNFKNMIITEIKAVTAAVVVKKEVTGINITNMLLHGLYGSGVKGFAIVSLKKTKNATSIVSVSEVYEDYTLKSILTDGVVFTKNNKEYILKMESDKKAKNVKKSYITRIPNPSSETEKKVSRNDIKSYAKNPKQIWKDISIVQLRDKSGFKITGVRKGSKMAELGLQKGDIMIRANNKNLKSYKDAINLYKNIEKISTLELVILRNNEEKEIIYEIN